MTAVLYLVVQFLHNIDSSATFPILGEILPDIIARVLQAALLMLQARLFGRMGVQLAEVLRSRLGLVEESRLDLKGMHLLL
jgi:hypothetical protein